MIHRLLCHLSIIFSFTILGGTTFCADVPTRQLVFSSNRTGNFEIFLINEDGTGARNLTNHPAEDSGPSWSPDGKRIVFQSNREGTTAIYLMDSDGSNIKRLAGDSVIDFGPAWSPKGNRIAWSRMLVRGDADVFITDPDGSNQRNLTNRPGVDSHPAWSPDERIVFGSGVSERGLYVINPDGSGYTRIHRVSRWGHPAWSPDGKLIAFSYGDSENVKREIYVCEPDGRNVRQLTHLANISTFAAWSPDGTKIAFQRHDISQDPQGAKPPPPGDLYIMDADGSNAKPIVRGETHGIFAAGSYAGGRPAWKPK